MIASIPPFALIISTTPATTSEMSEISNMLDIPAPTPESIDAIVMSSPINKPMTIDNTVPPDNTKNTLRPMIALIRTNKYGTIFQKLYVKSVGTSAVCPIVTK